MDFRIFSFEYPEAFVLFLFFVLCQLLCKRIVSTQYFPHLNLFSKGLSFLNLEKFIKYLTAFLLTIALASPVTIDKRHPNNRHGFDIALVLDSSNSMHELIGEAEASREKFSLMQEVVSDFIQLRQNDNISLIMFADFAYIASPLTYEKELLIDFFKMQTMGMAGKNTAIGDALAQGISSLESSKAKTKFMILLSDGEQNSGKVAIPEAVKIAQQRGIKIYVISVGEASAINEKIAEDSGGKYFVAKNPKVLKEVFNQIDTLSSSRIKARDYQEKNYYFFYFAFSAMLLMMWLVSREIRKITK
jgi:Ca-activated chloride channel homolog